MAYTIGNHDPLKTFGSVSLEKVDDFKYLYSRMQSKEKYIKVCKALAWKSHHDRIKIWTFWLTTGIKLRLYPAVVKKHPAVWM